MHPDLRYAGLMPPLDLPHHLRREDTSRYREGVVVERYCPDEPHSKKKDHQQQEEWTVDVGSTLVYIRSPTSAGLGSNVRVTVEMPARQEDYARVVSPREPVRQGGVYWGYSVRLCDSLSQVLSTTPPWSKDGEEYDLVIGTSERGASLTSLLQSHLSSSTSSSTSKGGIPPFRHALLLFGGLSGLEVAVESDRMIPLDADNAHQLFDLWLNVAEDQGSRTIRTEEAVLIALARLAPVLDQVGRRGSSRGT